MEYWHSWTSFSKFLIGVNIILVSSWENEWIYRVQFLHSCNEIKNQSCQTFLTPTVCGIVQSCLESSYAFYVAWAHAMRSGTTIAPPLLGQVQIRQRLRSMARVLQRFDEDNPKRSWCGGVKRILALVLFLVVCKNTDTLKLFSAGNYNYTNTGSNYIGFNWNAPPSYVIPFCDRRSILLVCLLILRVNNKLFQTDLWIFVEVDIQLKLWKETRRITPCSWLRAASSCSLKKSRAVLHIFSWVDIFRERWGWVQRCSVFVRRK